MESQLHKSILVVDDEPLTVQKHLQVLKGHDYKVHIVHKIDDAVWHLVNSDSNELILMDMELNGEASGVWH